MTKLTNSKCDYSKTQNLKKNNSKTHNVKKNLKNSKCDNSKNQIVTKLTNLKCDNSKTKNMKEKNSKTQYVKKNSKNEISKTQNVKKKKNSQTQHVFLSLNNIFCHNSKIICDNSKTQIVTKLKNSNWYKTQCLTNSISDKTSSKNNLTPQQQMRCSLGSVLRSRDVLITLWSKYWSINKAMLLLHSRNKSSLYHIQFIPS